MKMSRLPASGLRQRKHASKKCTLCPAPPIGLRLPLSPLLPLDDGNAERKGSVRAADSAEIGSLPPRRPQAAAAKSSVLFFLPPYFPARLRQMRGDAWWGGNARWCALAFNNGGGRAVLARATPQGLGGPRGDRCGPTCQPASPGTPRCGRRAGHGRGAGPRAPRFRFAHLQRSSFPGHCHEPARAAPLASETWTEPRPLGR
jgi:hypothetical protein